MPGTVTVGCKIPNGLVLRVFRMEDHDEPMFGGGTKTVKRAVAEPATVRLNGWARYKGQDLPYEVRHGAGLTYGVDADLFAKWLEQNKDSDLVRNGLVFAQAPKPGEVQAQAKDHRSLKSGLEPIDPGNLPAEFTGKAKIETYKAA